MLNFLNGLADRKFVEELRRERSRVSLVESASLYHDDVVAVCYDWQY